MISQETRLILALTHLRGIGRKTIAEALRMNPSAPPQLEKWRLPERLERAVSSRLLFEEAMEKAEQQILHAQQHGGHIISIVDNDYPFLLKKIPDYPVLLYIHGNLRSSNYPRLAIIGTRQPTDTGQEVARRIANYYAQAGWSIVSGLALGIDKVAHEAALDVNGHTVAILAHGLHMVAPSSHKRLSKRILEAGGALISEYPYEVEPSSYRFVDRDRLQAGVSSGVILVQTGEKGGSLHTSRFALEYGRILAFPVPGSKEKYHEKELGILRLATSSLADIRTFLQVRGELKGEQIFPLQSREDYPLLERALKDWDCSR